MGSGKSTVGPLVARALGWRFVDFDDRIVAEEGSSVADIFRTRGEPRFREVEARVARLLLQEDSVVLGAGGGWAGVPGRLREVPPGTVSVWLRVSAAEAVRRARGQAGARPLLDSSDPVATARALLERRAPAYAEADLEVDTEGQTAVSVSAMILALLERRPANRRAAEAR
jgi:shikimate kinase